MNRQIRIGILGCSNIGKRSIIPALLELKEYFKIIGIASRDMKKATEYSKIFNVEPVEGYQSLIEEEDIDAIYIPLPNALHPLWIEKSLQNNINVLVEKSLSPTKEIVYRLNEMARRSQLVLMENFQFRFHSQLTSVKRLIEEGKIGELRSIRSSFGFPPFPDPDNIRYQKSLGGGALYDAGAYCLKISQIFLGYDTSVSASKLFYDKERDIDIWGGGFVEQNNGSLFAEIAFGFDNYYQCSLEIWGSKGKMFTDRIFTAPPNHKPEILLETPQGTNIIQLEADNHYKNILSHFHKLIVTKNRLEDEYEQNYHQSRLIEEFKERSNA